MNKETYIAINLLKAYNDIHIRAKNSQSSNYLINLIDESLDRAGFTFEQGCDYLIAMNIDFDKVIKELKVN